MSILYHICICLTIVNTFICAINHYHPTIKTVGFPVHKICNWKDILETLRNYIISPYEQIKSGMMTIEKKENITLYHHESIVYEGKCPEIDIYFTVPEKSCYHVQSYTPIRILRYILDNTPKTELQQLIKNSIVDMDELEAFNIKFEGAPNQLESEYAYLTGVDNGAAIKYLKRINKKNDPYTHRSWTSISYYNYLPLLITEGNKKEIEHIISASNRNKQKAANTQQQEILNLMHNQIEKKINNLLIKSIVADSKIINMDEYFKLKKEIKDNDNVNPMVVIDTESITEW